MDEMKKFELCKELLSQWQQEDKEKGEFNHYPTNTTLAKLFIEEVEKETERSVINAIKGKGTKIDGKKIHERLREKAKNYGIRHIEV